MIEFYVHGDGTTSCLACHQKFPSEDAANHGMIRGGDSYPWMVYDEFHANHIKSEYGKS